MAAGSGDEGLRYRQGGKMRLPCSKLRDIRALHARGVATSPQMDAVVVEADRPLIEANPEGLELVHLILTSFDDAGSSSNGGDFRGR